MLTAPGTGGHILRFIILLFLIYSHTPPPVMAASSTMQAASQPASKPAGAPASIEFTEIDPVAAGITFEHRMGGSGKKFVAETMGSGVALLDADGDGHLDIYFLQGAPLPGTPPFDSRSQIYAGNGNWKFVDKTRGSGLEDAGYAMGVAVADINNDGLPDVYTSAYGRGHLFSNKGNFTFKDITEESGVTAAGFLASCGFADLDQDGFVDLYITNYLDFDEVSRNPYCGKHIEGGRSYCSPHAFAGAPDFLYKNLGDGRFLDVSKASDVARAGRHDGKGLGVTFSDFDDDGDPDIVVANDSCANFLYQNNGGMKFTEIGAIAGVAFAEDGHERAGMGIDAADADGDLRSDIFITNLAAEQNSLFRNTGKLLFEDWSGPSGLGPPAIPFVGFGCALEDFDGDGDRDALIVNGHILDNAHLFGDLSPYRQRPLLFINSGRGKFAPVPPAREFLKKTRVLRGLAIGDLDHDGDPDGVATASEGPPVLLRNDSRPQGARIVLKLKGKKSNACAIGARLVVKAGGVQSVHEVRTAHSYCSASDTSVALGLGGAATADTIFVRWPSGSQATASGLKAGNVYEWVEGSEPRPVGVLASGDH